MDDYLAKPVSIPVLVERLRRWLPHLALSEPGEPATASEPVPQLRDPVPVDEAILATISGGDSSAERELMRDFLGTTRNDLRALRQGFLDADLATVTREAHKIKGAARLVGSRVLGDAAESLEAAARAGQAAEVRALLPDLETAFERVQRWATLRYDR